MLFQRPDFMNIIYLVLNICCWYSANLKIPAVSFPRFHLSRNTLDLYMIQLSSSIILVLKLQHTVMYSTGTMCLEFSMEAFRH